MKRHSSKKSTPRGAITLEALLIIPVLVIATFGIFEYGIVLVVEQAISHAATVGAREYAKGASPAQVQTAVEAILDPHAILMGTNASLVLEDGPVVQPTIGTLACSPPASPVLVAGEVRATICVRLNQTPFANLLGTLGVDISDRCYSISSFAKKE